MPLSEKVRIEVFIPDLPDPIYGRLLDRLGDELTYAFGGCTVTHTTGKYGSASGAILPDKVNVLFTDTPFHLDEDLLIIQRYAQAIGNVVQSALEKEEAVLISLHPVFHA